MAAGYARSRPAVHPHVILIVQQRLGITRRLPRALDIGCGAGLSTKPLLTLAEQVTGVEPVETMARLAPTVVPNASFALAAAEHLPVRSHSMDLVTAAGSLNYADPARVLPELRRVLSPSGILVIYDFARAHTSSPLTAWDEEFIRRYPYPPCREIDPETLSTAPYGLNLTHHEPFEVSLSLAPDFYLEYVLTETNVAEAIRDGTPESEIRIWCQQTLAPVFHGASLDVPFAGYIAAYIAV